MSASNARQGILSLAVKDKAALYSAYMPFVKNGGIFVPTPKRYFLGDEVFLLLTLPDSSERLPVVGKVIWVTPVGAQGNRTSRHRRATGRWCRRRGRAPQDRDPAGRADRFGQADPYDVIPVAPGHAGCVPRNAVNTTVKNC